MVLKLYSSGSNARGQLAQDTEDDSHIFQPCLFASKGDEWPNGSRIESVAAGANHTLVLVSSGGDPLSFWSEDVELSLTTITSREELTLWLWRRPKGSAGLEIFNFTRLQ